MVKYRKWVKGESIVGQQKRSIRVTVPREISNILEINPGDKFIWKFNPTEKKPVLTVEIISKEELQLEKDIL